MIDPADEACGSVKDACNGETAAQAFSLSAINNSTLQCPFINAA